MAERTVSELAFEEYLSKRGIIARYEELPNGITQPADYSFELEGKTLRIDVKEWAPQEQFLGVGSLDPYNPVRKKIEDGRKKFKQYMGSEYQEEVKQIIYLFLRQNSPYPAKASF